MKLKFFSDNLHNILKALLFVGVIIIISYLLPNQETFKYQFDIGKPWSYELITASFDFPIYKSDVQVQQEKTALLKSFVPYFKLDTSVMSIQYEKFTQDYMQKKGEEHNFDKFIHNKFHTIYDHSIIAADQYQKLKADNISEINCIMPNKVIRIIKVEDLYSPKMAYQEFVKSSPSEINTYNLHLYLIENLKYDSVISELSKKEMLKNLSLNVGHDPSRRTSN